MKLHPVYFRFGVRSGSMAVHVFRFNLLHTSVKISFHLASMTTREKKTCYAQYVILLPLTIQYGQCVESISVIWSCLTLITDSANPNIEM